MNPNSQAVDAIEPVRFLPFDIGCEIDDNIQQKFHQEFDKQFDSLNVDEYVIRLLRMSSDYFLFGYKITDTIGLYVYQYGIAVFVIKGETYYITERYYAADYCAKRKEKHASYLELGNPNIPTLREIAAQLRTMAHSIHPKLRTTAHEDWEHGGFSYVVTISTIIGTTGHVGYQRMDDADKRNVQIMLDPSLAGKEDSLVFSCNEESTEETCQLDVENIDSPKDYLNNSNKSLYISWAAVLLYLDHPDQRLQQMLVALEIDLQAMWMYVYCVNDDLVKVSRTRELKVSKLRRNLYSFQKLLNEFLQLSDTSLPNYVLSIRNELIRTSDIEKHV